MEYLPNGFTLEIPSGCFPLSTDSMVLGYFAGNLGTKRVLDLGSGCGTLGLLLCSANEHCRVTGVELDEEAHRAALHNIECNHLVSRMESICTDLRQVPRNFVPGSFDCCISNPPYFSGGAASAHLLARREDACPLSALMESAAWALKYGGDFYLVHRPERLAEIIAAAAPHKLEAKQLVLLRHQAGKEVSLVLLRLRKGGKPGLTIQDWGLREADGTPTDLYRKIYHLQED